MDPFLYIYPYMYLSVERVLFFLFHVCAVTLYASIFDLLISHD